MAKKIVKKPNDWIETIEARYGLSKSQLKILAKLSSMINKDDTDFKWYHFNVSKILIELEMGEDNHNYLKKQTHKMAGKVAQFIDRDGFLNQHGLIHAKYSPDNKVLMISFHPDLKPYFIQMKGCFTTYELRALFALRGKYAMRLYELFKLYQFKGSFEKSLKFLRDYFGLEDGKYSQIGHFNKRVVEDSIKDIEDNTDLEIEYKFLKRGKKVTGYKFWILEKGTKAQREKALSPPPPPKLLFKGTDQQDIELESLRNAKKELTGVNAKIDLYEHYKRTEDNIKISEANEELPKLAKQKRIIERNIKELEDEISKRK